MTETKTTRPAETRAAPDTLKSAFDGFLEAFEGFKEANDRRLAEIERRQSADCLTQDKVDRINRALDEQKGLIDEMLVKAARPALGDPRGETRPQSLEGRDHARAFAAYLRRGEETGLRAAEQKAMAGQVQAEGGYLVPEETDREIGRRLALLSPVRAIASVVKVSSASFRKPVSAGSFASGWVAEKGPRTETATPALSELAFDTMELYAMPAATQSLLDDAAVDLDQWIAAEIDTAFAEQESLAFISGDGVLKPKGILSYPAIDETVWSDGSLGYVPTGAAGAFSATHPGDDLIEATYALKARYRQNARFLMNRRTQGEIRKFKGADGHYLWQPPAGAGQAATLLGFPVAEAETMPDLAPDAFPIAIGDFAAGYLVVDRAGVRMLRDPYSAKPYVLFYTTKRVGGGIKDFDAIKLIRTGTA